MKPVLILGVGPAGLMAAHACKLKGVPFSIVGNGGKSVIGGAQFLHAAVPLLTSDAPDGFLTYHVAGHESGYKEKVYGDSDVPFVSMGRVKDDERVPIWSMQRAYDLLWNDIAGGGFSVTQANVTPEWVISEIEADRWRYIVSTIPRHQMCLSVAGLIDGPAHSFTSQQIQISRECMLNYSGNMEESHIWYDGTRNVSWYRTSNIFGEGSTEWGMRDLPYKTVAVRKPISTTCQCFNGKVMFTGRYGAWRKGILIHQAFADTWRLIDR
jgi:hypothetical protein